MLKASGTYWRQDTNRPVDPSSSHRLQSLISQAAHQVPFYRDLWRAAGVDAAKLHLPDDLCALPIITKADLLRIPIEHRLAAAAGKQRFVTERSSGSTGQPFEMWLAAATMRHRQYRFMRALLAAGYRPGRKLMLVATRRSSAAMRLLRWTYVDLRDDESSLLKSYLSVAPSVLYAPLSSLLILAQQLAQQEPGAPRPAALISKAEPLREWHRETMSTYLSSIVTDFYGMTELGFVALRRQEDPCYRIPENTFILEFLPAGTPQAEERLIVTDLSNTAMPMIRYDTGDLVRRDFSRPGYPIVEFSGRSVDRLRLPNGTFISPLRVEAGIEEIAGVERFELEQDANLDLKIDLWTGNNAAAAERVAAFMRGVCADSVRIVITQRQDSPELPSGSKLRPIRSLANTRS